MATFGGPADWWTDNTDKGRKHIAKKGIVQNGLALNLDASIRNLYSEPSTTWVDLSTNSNNATLINGSTFDTSGAGSVSFDGIDDYASVSYLGTYDETQLSVQCMVYFTKDGAAQHLFTRDRSNTLTDRHWQFKLNDSDVKVVLFDNNNSVIFNTGYTASLPNNQWFNIAFTAGSGNVNIFLNGVNVFNSTYSGTINNTSTLSLPITIGANGVTSHRGLSGKMSNLLFYDRVLTSSEIRHNYTIIKGRFGL